MPKKAPKEIHPSLLPLSTSEFMASYNKNMPENYPRASAVLLQKFQELHPSLFKHGNQWSLDLHRKKFFEWLPRNTKSA
ncbi:MAG: hypothetical protein A3D65_06380 [Candidatus Lloydbacteria bacterium RIFCSPHIGHO2_02_FULL_50_13]|uniref:Uncharacterized protein n=1 Tax=Candidatus Lloydbacteria bacterium RIFCSPHIGHO2_02_FULL_50_13 TaxID=1798661 RepID=A0A1G2D3V9_9BACT|nr:MAG: hypothetical protein A3D65_06380 [Candidatus Lloydbacteria bacterium RIFCSPHIGHO2_02_FULL_50_13]